MAKFMILVMVFSVGFSVPTRSVHAGYWGEEWMVEFYDTALDKILYYLEGVLLSKLKSAAMRMLDQQIEKLVGGGGGNAPMFITDFREYIGGVATDYTHDVMNDFFTNSLQGKFSVANYLEVGGVPGFSRSGGNSLQLTAMISQEMQGVVSEYVPTFDYDQNSAGPGLPGTMRDLNLFVENAMNNPVGAQIESKRMFEETLSENAEIQKIKALASGYAPKEKDGQVLTPSGTIEAIVDRVKTTGLDEIANAANWQELAAGVASSYANKVITKAIQTGIGKVESKIAQKFGTTGLAIAKEIGNDYINNGPGTQFATKTIEKGKIEYQSISNPSDTKSSGSSSYFNDWSFSSKKVDAPAASKPPSSSGVQWGEFTSKKLSD